MSASIDTKRTNRFIDPGLYIAFGAAGLVLLALFVSPFFKKTLFSRNVQVSEGEVLKLESLPLQPQPVGALRIDTNAIIPNNRWVTFEIQVLDKQGNLIASAVKQAWRESGTWYEDGESGTWSEGDLKGGLDVRAQNREEVTLALSVLESGDTSGRELDVPVSFDVKVDQGVIDTRHLWPGLFGTLALSVMSAIATPLTGKKVISKTINDSDPSDRATVGGADKLVRVKVDMHSDEHTPTFIQVRLVINDSYGQQLYDQYLPLQVNFTREDGKVEKATGKAQAYFILNTRDSYGFHVEVLPDNSVDQTTLTVRDGTRTRRSVEVVHIKSTTDI